MEYSITLYLDKRRAIKDTKNVYPVKIRVYATNVKKKKLYGTNVNLTIDDFDQIVDAQVNVRGKKLDIRNYLLELLQRAKDAAKDLTVFTFSNFEKKLFRSKNASTLVSYHYQTKIESLYKNGQVGSASNYELSLKAIGMFLLNKAKFQSQKAKNQQVENATKNLTFYDIDKKWLEKFENFMVKEHGRSYTTVSIYLRCLRTIFNSAITENDIKRDLYPFGRGKYQIPSSQKSRKTLTKEQLNLLFHGIPEDSDQQRAKDFWFLSYSLNGMNMKDLLLLKWDNISEDRISYFRKKTITTKKSNLKEITVFLNDYSKGVIKKYANKSSTNKGYIFDIITANDTAIEEDKKVKNFISHINHFFDKYAKSLGFEFKISTYWARHSFATISIQKGASMEFISEALNHSNLNVTKQYFSGFEDEAKKEFANALMDFE